MKKIMVLAIMLFSASAIWLNAGGDKTQRDGEMENNKKLEKATFAGGCFWCMEHPFEELDGVYEVISGYAGGHNKNPTYEEVSSGSTGHAEVVQVSYDPEKVTFNKLLHLFWRQIDPTDDGGSFVDRGSQYRSAIFYHNEDQKRLAETSRDEIDRSGKYEKPVVTEIVRLTEFFEAEEYHQDYAENNPLRYKHYRYNSGRDQYLQKMWSKEREEPKEGHKRLSDEELEKRLTPIQYKVTRKDGTERAFQNEYWDNKREGIYVDIISGEPLFSSTDKFDSGTGWPSFTKPIEPDEIVEKEDSSFFTVRTEVRSRDADSHLGHLFNDGPAPTGLRYCINSASLRFISKEELEKEGLDQYKKLFE